MMMLLNQLKLFLKKVTESIKEGLQQRDKEKAENEAKKEKGDESENKTKEEKKINKYYE